ncbi:MAG: DUF1775 domain-containing protein [Pseudomonadota bacterium]
MMKMTLTAAFGALILGTTAAYSHATLETKESTMNTNYKAVMRISHGCEGEATLKVRVQIPEGVINVKPMPKAGWELATVEGDYAKTYEYYGERSSGVKEIVWTGELQDTHYDEFIFRARITESWDEGDMLYFPTVQECANGTQDWVEIPAVGQDPHDLDGPAPGLMLKGAVHSH